MRKASTAMRRRYAQGGATLIEVLVAILIFALGMVGIAGLMAAAIKYQIGNEARLQVSAAINDLSERIRANTTGANGYHAIVNGVLTTGTGYQLSDSYATQASATAATVSPDCGTANCTPAQLASHDQAQWRQLLRNALPGGAGFISGDVHSGFTVSVMWFDKSAVGSDDAALANQSCSDAKSNQTTPSTRFCCPAEAAAPDGVRCYTTRVLP